MPFFDDNEQSHPNFDATFYTGEYAGLKLSAESALSHFLEVGWLEARNPNPQIDTWKILSQKPLANRSAGDVLNAERSPTDKVAFSLTNLIPSYSLGTEDIIQGIIRKTIDFEYYIAKFFGDRQEEAKFLNLAHHFLAGPCRDGERPFVDLQRTVQGLSQTDSKKLLEWIPQALAAINDYKQLSDILVEIEQTLRRGNTDVQETGSDISSGLDEDQQFILSKIAEHIDQEFYVRRNPDVKAAGIDPALHFAFTGWKERRNPTLWFETDYYIRANVDVREAGINPFYHYIVAGMAEGRLPKRPGSTKRKIIEEIVPAKARQFGAPDLAEERKLNVQILSRLINSATEKGGGLALSVSHDCYLRSVGGTQIFIADEEKGFSRSSINYLHISPTKFAPFVSRGRIDYLLQIVLNGQYLGIISINRLKEALLTSKLPSQRPSAMIHVMLGHDLELLSDLILTFNAERNYVWLHDYSTICTGFNLLRNDVEFCGGPELTSMACRVCVHGAERSEHIKIVRDFFARIKPVAVAPSDRAAEIWWKAKTVDCDTVLVVPHSQLVPTDTKALPRAEPGTGWDPVKVAFVGYPLYHKGWPTFERLLDRHGSDPRFEFFHFASEQSKTFRSEVKFIPIEVSPSSRFAAIDALVTADVDVVVNPSPWPETFSYVAHETAAAGALTYTLESSGNVAAMVTDGVAGRAFADETDLLQAFSDGTLIDNVRTLIRRGKRRSNLVSCGTTAAILETGINL